MARAPSASGSPRRSQLDLVGLTRKFYQSHADTYDQLVVWTDTAIIRDAFAYETTVANEIRGIGIDVYDASRDFGSGGRLRSLAVMDWVGKYPDDPTQKFLGENNTLSVLGQEVGHRWLAFLEFRDRTGQRSQALLGRGVAHWSFFFDSDASVMEGNDIEDLGGGAFRTTAAVQRFSRTRSIRDGPAVRIAGAVVLLRGESGQRRAKPRSGGWPARRRHVQRHAARRADPGHHGNRGAARARRRGARHACTGRPSSIS